MNNKEQPIEVLNPCDDGDDQKTPTTILFSNEGEFLGRFRSKTNPDFSFWKRWIPIQDDIGQRTI